MKHTRIIMALGLLYASPAFAGGLCIDCIDKHPSTAPINANDRMKGAGVMTDWSRWNQSRDAEDAATMAHRAQERADRAQQASDRANRAIERSANASANESNARAGLMDRMYRPRPFQSGY